MNDATEARRARVERLESIRGLGMEGQYDEALGAISKFLAEYPNDLEAIRLKGNTLELKVLDRAQNQREKLLRTAEYVEAQRCYESILVADPSNTLALIDLGDHFVNVGALDKARSYYEQAIEVLRTGEYELSWIDEVNEVFDRYVDLCQTLGLVDRKAELGRDREALLLSARK